MAGARRGQVEAFIKIIGEDAITEILTKATRQLDDMAAGTNRNAKVAKKYTGEVKRAKASWQAMALGIDAAVNVAGKAVNVIGQVADQWKEAALEFGIEERFKSVTKSAGGAARAMDRLKIATAGAIDETSLQKMTAAAMTGGVKIEQMVRLVEAAQKAANKGYGTSIDLTQQFVSAVLKGRDGSLRALGLQMNMNKAVANYALSVGKSTSKVKDAEERQVRYNELMRALDKAVGGFSAEGHVQQVDKMTAAWENFKSKMRRTALVYVFDPLRRAITWTPDVVEKAVDALAMYEAAVGEIDRAVAGSTYNQSLLSAGFQELARAQAVATDAGVAYTDAVDQARVSVELALRGAEDRAATMILEAQHAERIGATTAAYKKYKAVLDMMPPAHERSAAMANAAAKAQEGLSTTTQSYEAKARAQIEAQDAAAKSSQRLEFAMARQLNQMGRGHAAAAHFVKGLDLINTAAPMTTATLVDVANAAAQVNRALSASLSGQIEYIQGAVDAGVATAGEVAQLQSLKDALVALARETAAPKRTRARGGGGGGARRERAEWAKVVQRGTKADPDVEIKGTWSMLKMKDKDWLQLVPGGPAVPRIGSPYYKTWAATRAKLIELEQQESQRAAEANEQYVQERSALLAEAEKRGIELKRGLSNERIQIMFDEADRTRAAMREIDGIVRSQSEASMSRAVGFAGQFGNRWVAAFAQSSALMKAEAEKAGRIFELVEKGQITSGQAVGKAAPGMIAASGQVAGAFIKDTERRAGIQSAFEFAAAAASWAVGNVPGAIAHTLSATLYAAVASGATKGQGGSTRGGPNRPQTITRPPGTEAAAPANQITLNISGTIVGNDEAAGRQLANMIKKEMRWGAMT